MITVEDDTWVDSSRFDLSEYLAAFDPDLLDTTKGRRAITRTRPLLFALLYLPHLLKSPETGGEITWADTHLAFARYGRSWIRDGGLRADRHVFVAPRDSAKSTWFFKILPLWAAAHRHKQFIAAFSSSSAQAESHLKGFKNELDTNRLLQADFPKLCRPMRRPSGVNVSDTQGMLFTSSQFSFAAKGIDADILGMVDPVNRRPQVLILDDIEPDETNYSAYQSRGRLMTMLDTILPMNERAHVALVGTVTMAGSIIHQLIQSKLEPGNDTPNWIEENKFQVHYFAPILDTEDGGRRSVWPGKWPLEYLTSIEHTRGYAKNFLNLPVSTDGDYWTPQDIRYRDVEATSACLSIDPAVTNTKKSDFYGIAIVAFQAPKKDGNGKIVELPRAAVRHARAVRLSPAGLRTLALQLLADYPEIGVVVVETNQGGDTWKEILHDLPVRVITVWQNEPKEARAGRLLNRYQRDMVTHAYPLAQAETQMCAYPNVLNDDIIDAIGTGVHFYWMKRKRRRATSFSPR
jgi:hypothetical protein